MSSLLQSSHETNRSTFINRSYNYNYETCYDRTFYTIKTHKVFLT